MPESAPPSPLGFVVKCAMPPKKQQSTRKRRRSSTKPTDASRRSESSTPGGAIGATDDERNAQVSEASMTKRALDEFERSSVGEAHESVAAGVVLGMEGVNEETLSSLAGRTPLTGSVDAVKYMETVVDSVPDHENMAMMRDAAQLLAHAQTQSLVLIALTALGEKMDKVSKKLDELCEERGAADAGAKPSLIDHSVVQKLKDFFAHSISQLMGHPVEPTIVGSIVARHSVFCTVFDEYLFVECTTTGARFRFGSSVLSRFSIISTCGSMRTESARRL